MKKRFKKWLDNLMWRFGYIPMSRVEGVLLIANKEKFELVVLQEQHSLSARDLTQSCMPWERHRWYIEREIKRSIGEKVFNMGELMYEAPSYPIPNGSDNDLYRLRFRIYIAVRIK